MFYIQKIYIDMDADKSHSARVGSWQMNFSAEKHHSTPQGVGTALSQARAVAASPKAAASASCSDAARAGRVDARNYERNNKIMGIICARV